MFAKPYHNQRNKLKMEKKEKTYKMFVKKHQAFLKKYEKPINDGKMIDPYEYCPNCKTMRLNGNCSKCNSYISESTVDYREVIRLNNAHIDSANYEPPKNAYKSGKKCTIKM